MGNSSSHHRNFVIADESNDRKSEKLDESLPTAPTIPSIKTIQCSLSNFSKEFSFTIEINPEKAQDTPQIFENKDNPRIIVPNHFPVVKTRPYVIQLIQACDPVFGKEFEQDLGVSALETTQIESQSPSESSPLIFFTSISNMPSSIKLHLTKEVSSIYKHPSYSFKPQQSKTSKGFDCVI